MLAKANISYEDIKFNMSFDISIDLVSGTKYTGTLTLDLPVENIIQKGKASLEKTDFSDVIFKRN